MDRALHVSHRNWILGMYPLRAEFLFEIYVYHVLCTDLGSSFLFSSCCIGKSSYWLSSVKGVVASGELLKFLIRKIFHE